MTGHVLRVVACMVGLTMSLALETSWATNHGTAGAGGSAIWTHMTGAQPGSTTGQGHVTTAANSSPAGTWHYDPACEIGQGGSQTCSNLAYCDDGSPLMYVWFEATDGSTSSHGTNCPVEAAVAAPTVTPGLVLRAFRRIPLPASELVVQPPGGRTLVNFETNFYTERGELTRVVRLLGQRVELRIWPDSFTWRYGDGASERTSSAGSPYPDLEITHRYRSTGRVAVSVDTTYAADFRVGAGAWRHVDGTVTIPGEAEGLRVVTARPVLVGG